jgi:hypothetical protein
MSGKRPVYPVGRRCLASGQDRGSFTSPAASDLEQKAKISREAQRKKSADLVVDLPRQISAARYESR